MGNFNGKNIDTWGISEIEYNFKVEGSFDIYWFSLKYVAKESWQIIKNRIDLKYVNILHYEKSLFIFISQ